RDHIAAEAISDNDSAPARQAFFNAAKELSDYNVAQLNKQIDATSATYRSTLITTLVVMAVLVVISILLGLSIARAIVTPLRSASRVADAIADGKLDNPIIIQSNDESGQLMRSMGRMQDQLQTVIEAQRQMSRHHDEGTVSFRIDESRFPGDYGTMVHDLNTLVNSHIET